MLLVVSLLVNALCMSAIMTQEMEHSAEHLVKTNQLHAVDAAAAKHALAHVDSRSASPPSAVSSSSPAAAARSGPPAVKARSPSFKAPLSDSAAAVKHKKRAAVYAMTSSHLTLQKPVTPGRFNIEKFRLALLKRRAEREEGQKPATPLRSPIRLRGAGDNPNDESNFVVDKRGAFYDPKLKVLVDARLLGTRTAAKEREAVVKVAELKAAEAFLPQLHNLTTEDEEGHLITVKENEAQQLAGGIFDWGYENPDTGDMRIDCDDTLANADSNGGAMNRFWGGIAKVDACGPRDPCEDNCAYEPCNIGATYRVECPGNCGHYGADVFGGAGRTFNVFMDDSSICRAALSVGVGSKDQPFLVDIKVVEAQPAYEGALRMGKDGDITTFNYVWHRWDWAENPRYKIPYSGYDCCWNPGAGAAPHLGQFTPTAEFRMGYDGVKWVNRVAFTVEGGKPPPPDAPPPLPPCPNDPPQCPADGAECGCKPGACNMPPQCPQDGPECCKNDPCNAPNPPDTCPCGGPYTGACVSNDCASPNPPAHCPCDGPYTRPCPPVVDCSKNLALEFNGGTGDGGELEHNSTLGLEGEFRQKNFAAVTVEMWLKDDTFSSHRTVYFGGGEFKDQGYEAENSCILSGFALGQWKGMLTFDVATEGGIAGRGCGVHVRSPDWALGVHKGKWVHVAGTYDGGTGETSLYIDGKIVHTDLEGSGAIVWPSETAKFVLGRNGDFIHSMGGSTGMDGELDEIRVWTVARSRASLIEFMHKTMPDNGAFGPYPMDTVALYLRFECQEAQAAEFHRVCSSAKWPMAFQLGSYPTTQLVESGAPLEILVEPGSSCPAAPDHAGPQSWNTYEWPPSDPGKWSLYSD
jgi:hypothetical protein